MSTIFFTINKSKWWVIIVSKPPLILLSYPPLKSKMINLLRKYCEIALQKHKYNYLFEVKKKKHKYSNYQDIYTIKAHIYFYNYLIK